MQLAMCANHHTIHTGGIEHGGDIRVKRDVLELLRKLLPQLRFRRIDNGNDLHIGIERIHRPEHAANSTAVPDHTQSLHVLHPFGG
jgi:hypothetical protein